MPPPTFVTTIFGSGEPDPVPGCRESVTEAIGVLLLNLRSSDNTVRTDAEDNLNDLASDDVGAFICALATLLETERPGDCALRVQAAIALRHHLFGAWISLDASSKEIVKNCLLRSVRDNLPTALRASLFSAFVIAVSCVCAPSPFAYELDEKCVKLHRWPQFLSEFCSLLGSEVPHRRLNALLLLGFLARLPGEKGNTSLFSDEAAIVLVALETGLRDADLEMQLAAVTATLHVEGSVYGCSDELDVQSLCPLILDVMKCMVENGHCSKARSVIELFACRGTWLFELHSKEFAQFLLQMARMFGAEDEETAALSHTALYTLICIFEQQELWHGSFTMPFLDALLHLCIELLAQLDICRGTFENGQVCISRMAETLGCNIFFVPAFCVINQHLMNAACWQNRRAALFAAAEVRDGCRTLCQEHLQHIVEIVSVYKSDPQPEVCVAATTVLDLLEGVDVQAPMVLD